MTILILEDEQAIREVEAAYLRRAGFSVVECADAYSARDALAEARYDLLLIDLNVPGNQGLDFCRELRRHTDTPMLLVTARTGDEDELAGLQCGADDYIKKPFNPDVLVARVQACLRRHSETVLRVRDLIMDPASQTVRTENAVVSLTTTQFRILHLLASRPERIYARDEIVQRAYDDHWDCETMERTIDAHVMAIRKALGDDPRRPRYIMTVIGRGYKFLAEG